MSNRLPLGKKMAYAAGGLAMNLSNLVISQWLLKLYVPSKELALISPVLFSIIFLLGRITDGITDPVIGYVSDHLKSKYGRRIPFILIFIVPAALVTFLLWIPPFPSGLHWANGLYVFILVQLFFIFWTAVLNPYLSLIPEITTNLGERVNISTLQAIFVMVGTIISGFIGPIKEAVGWGGMGAMIGVLSVVCFLPTLFAIREKPQEKSKQSEEKKPATMKLLVQWVATTFKNRPFLFILSTTAIFWFSLNLLIIMIPFWVQYYLIRSDADVVLVMAPFLVSNIIFFLIFNLLAKRFGKYPLFLFTLLGSAVSIALLCFVSDKMPGSLLLQTQIAVGLAGIPVAGFLMLPFALLADVIDYDEKLTGKRREAIYFGVQAIFQKTAIGISIAVATVLMYVGGDLNPTPRGLKLVALASALSALVAFFVFLRYPIREKEGKVYLVRE